jgi:hypothetical protein
MSGALRVQYYESMENKTVRVLRVYLERAKLMPMTACGPESILMFGFEVS